MNLHLLNHRQRSGTAISIPQLHLIEQSYLLNAVNSFLKNQISESDIVWTYAGIRPLLEDFNQSCL